MGKVTPSISFASLGRCCCVLGALLVVYVPVGLLPCRADRGEPGSGSAPPPEEVLTGRYGPGGFMPEEGDDGTTLGIACFCAGGDGEVIVADASGRKLRVYGSDGVTHRDIGVPEGRKVFRLASSEARIYALCSLEEDSEEAVGGEGPPGKRLAQDRGDKAGARHDEERLLLLVYSLAQCRWEGGETPVRMEIFDTSAGRADRVEQRVVLLTCGGDVYLYDPHLGRHTRLTVNRDHPAPVKLCPSSAEGRPLRCGARALRFGRGISLLWEDGSRRDMPWLAGSLIGSDAEGRLYMCEVDYGGDQPEVCVAVYDGGARPAARWALPGRPGEVRMLGPRVMVSADGGVYEFWSSSSEFHIVCWRAGDQAAQPDWRVNL